MREAGVKKAFLRLRTNLRRPGLWGERGGGRPDSGQETRGKKTGQQAEKKSEHKMNG